MARSTSTVRETLWYFTVILDPYPFLGLLGFFIKAAKSLIYSYPPECSQGKVNVSGRSFEFDGNIPHATCPFQGERFCIIFFVNHGYAKLPAQDVSYLKSFGFKWPKRGLKKPDYGPRAARLLAAAAALPKYLASSGRSKAKEG